MEQKLAIVRDYLDILIEGSESDREFSARPDDWIAGAIYARKTARDFVNKLIEQAENRPVL